MKLINHTILILICLLPGCVVQDRTAWTVKDSWYNAPIEKGAQPWEWEVKQIMEVKSESQKEAQSLLAERQIMQLTNSQAKNFSGQQINKTESNLYLIRGVYLNEGSGNFSIYSRGKQLWVYHGSLGHSAVPMKRKAIIVSLDQKPEEIFVTCMMDE